MINHGHKILTFDNVIPNHICDGITQAFEQILVKHGELVTRNYVCDNCTECNCTRLGMTLYPEFEELYYYAMNHIANCIDQYKKEVISEYANWPTTYDWEEISIKKYEADSEQGQTPHSDQFNIASAKRFLIFFGYLSDCDQGETEFPELNITIPPTKGSILLFPPFWTHIHKGCPPVRNHKYIIKSSLMYIN